MVNYPPPVAAFTADVTSGGAPLKVAFTSQSSGPIDSRLWDFGDGTTSSYGTHIYKTPGVYTVSLTLTGPGGTNTETKTNYVSIYTPPFARFTANVLSGKAPLQVIFTDSSRGDVTTWQWDSGDGGTSSNKSPTHTYNKSGTYSVTLTASGPGGTDTETKPDYLIVKPPPRAANFITNFADVEIAETVRFTNTSTGDFTSCLWDFGDGQQSTLQNPTHTYDSPGTSR